MIQYYHVNDILQLEAQKRQVKEQLDNELTDEQKALIKEEKEIEKQLKAAKKVAIANAFTKDGKLSVNQIVKNLADVNISETTVPSYSYHTIKVYPKQTWFEKLAKEANKSLAEIQTLYAVKK